jgi:hypothetical protein
MVENQMISFQSLMSRREGMANEEEDKEGDFGGMEKVNDVEIDVHYL